MIFAWQVQAVLGVRDTAFAWQVQNFESLVAASGQGSPRGRAHSCIVGIVRREFGIWLGRTISAGPRTFFASQVQHSVHPLDSAFGCQVQNFESPGAASGQRCLRDRIFFSY